MGIKRGCVPCRPRYHFRLFDVLKVVVVFFFSKKMYCLRLRVVLNVVVFLSMKREAQAKAQAQV
jgi:hypothetical protein